jgi:hypothetical protein
LKVCFNPQHKPQASPISFTADIMDMPYHETPTGAT